MDAETEHIYEILDSLEHQLEVKPTGSRPLEVQKGAKASAIVSLPPRKKVASRKVPSKSNVTDQKGRAPASKHVHSRLTIRTEEGKEVLKRSRVVTEPSLEVLPRCPKKDLVQKEPKVGILNRSKKEKQADHPTAAIDKPDLGLQCLYSSQKQRLSLRHSFPNLQKAQKSETMNFNI